MSYKLDKKSINQFDPLSLLEQYEKALTELCKEANSKKGETKTTIKTVELLKQEILERMNKGQEFS